MSILMMRYGENNQIYIHICISMDKDLLIKELNELSDFTNLSEEEKHKRKIRMIEIAKILLHDHYWWKKNPPKEKNWL